MKSLKYVHTALQSDHLSIEKLLVHTIHVRSLTKLKVNLFRLNANLQHVYFGMLDYELYL